MNKYIKHIITAFLCFLFVMALNFLLPRLIPSDPIGYLTGFDEEIMSEELYNYYFHALHLDENLFVQFKYYLISLFDGTLGYSFKKECNVSSLIFERLPLTFEIMIPSIIISITIALFWGLECGYKKNGWLDKISTTSLITINTIPTFVIGLLLVVLLCFKNRWFPYLGLNSGNFQAGTIEYFWDRVYHLILPILTTIISTLPSRFLLVRNISAEFRDDKSVLFAEQRGLNKHTIKFRYIFSNVRAPFITMAGSSLGAAFGGSIIVENIFSINGIGGLLNEATKTLDYPLMQGILFVTTLVMLISVVVSDLLCIALDPKIRKGNYV